uniref:Phenylalanine--tRNA ligase beta subunit n=1 Tax=Lygus hesperus TaxID=30085 RepID=A0A0A9WLM0_LYGHE
MHSDGYTPKEDIPARQGCSRSENINTLDRGVGQQTVTEAPIVAKKTLVESYTTDPVEVYSKVVGATAPTVWHLYWQGVTDSIYHIDGTTLESTGGYAARIVRPTTLPVHAPTTLPKTALGPTPHPSDGLWTTHHPIASLLPTLQFIVLWSIVDTVRYAAGFECSEVHIPTPLFNSSSFVNSISISVRHKSGPMARTQGCCVHN